MRSKSRVKDVIRPVLQRLNIDQHFSTKYLVFCAFKVSLRAYLELSTIYSVGEIVVICRTCFIAGYKGYVLIFRDIAQIEFLHSTSTFSWDVEMIVKSAGKL